MQSGFRFVSNSSLSANAQVVLIGIIKLHGGRHRSDIRGRGGREGAVDRGHKWGFICVCLLVWVGAHARTHSHQCLCPLVCFFFFFFFPPLCLRAPSVSGILNTQLSILVNRARGTPEAQVAQLQVDTLNCEHKPRPYLPLSKQGCGKGDAKCDVGRCVKGKHSREPLLRQRQNYLHALAAGGLIHSVDERDKELAGWCRGQRRT